MWFSRSLFVASWLAPYVFHFVCHLVLDYAPIMVFITGIWARQQKAFTMVSVIFLLWFCTGAIRQNELCAAIPELPMSPGLSAPYAHTGGDPFYAHHAGIPSSSMGHLMAEPIMVMSSALPGSSLLNYVRPRYHDESYRRHDDRPLSPPNRPSVSFLSIILFIFVY